MVDSSGSDFRAVGLKADAGPKEPGSGGRNSSADHGAADLEASVCDQACLLCEHCQDTSGKSCMGYCVRRRATAWVLAVALMTCAVFAGLAAFWGLPTATTTTTTGTLTTTITTTVAATTTLRRSRLHSARKPPLDVVNRTVEEDPELRLEEVCSASAPGAPLPPREAWQLSAEEQHACYANVITQYKAGSDPLLALQVEKSGRSWCWVAFKEHGCHGSIFSFGRPHMTWEEMRWKASWILPRPNYQSMYQPLLHPEICDRRDLGSTRVWTAWEWHAAWVWFTKYVTVYVVNLKSNVERWKAVQQHLDKLHLTYKRVWGVDMREDGALKKAKQEGLVPDDYEIDRAQAKAMQTGQAMGGILGTVGCASAHFRAQTTAYKEAKTPLAVVFEDDVSPEGDFVPKLWNLVRNELPCDWQVVSLRSMCPFGTCVSDHLTRVQPDVNEPADRCRHGVNYGFQGVLYRIKGLEDLQKRWQHVVFNESRPHCLDVDVALASMSDTVGFYAVPFVQYPGFLRERREGSSRFSINQNSRRL